MKRNYKELRSHDNLRGELRRLKLDYRLREIALKHDAKAYVSQFTVHNLVKKYATPNGFIKLDEQTHISSKIMSIALPMILNATVFRGSGLITKAVGALVSGKLGQSIDAESLTSAFNKVKSLFTGKKKKAKSTKFIDYGIPPDSETY